MSKEEFIRLLEIKGIFLKEFQIKQFQQYFKTLVEWNKKMNLTAITDEEEVYLKHFYDSLTIAFDFDFNNQSIIDVGAGAGFPSIPLKIVYPDLKITISSALSPFKAKKYPPTLTKGKQSSSKMFNFATALAITISHFSRLSLAYSSARALIALQSLNASSWNK